jgi:hypothetical protein
LPPGRNHLAPRLIYVSQTPTNVNVDFTEMPTEAHVVFVNVTSAAPLTERGCRRGRRRIRRAIPIESSLITGQYYLIARDSDNQLLAQTVRFYVNTGDSNDL